MKLYFVRHGITDWNVNKITQGRTDIPLNDIGREQARRTAQLIEDKHIDICICSPLSRARETAQIILSGRDVPIVYDDRIMERDFGELEGQPFDRTTEEKEATVKFWSPSFDNSAYGVETMPHLIKRVDDFLDDIKVKYRDKAVLIVAHGGLSPEIKCFLLFNIGCE